MREAVGVKGKEELNIREKIDKIHQDHGWSWVNTGEMNEVLDSLEALISSEVERVRDECKFSSEPRPCECYEKLLPLSVEAVREVMCKTRGGAFEGKGYKIKGNCEECFGLKCKNNIELLSKSLVQKFGKEGVW